MITRLLFCTVFALLTASGCGMIYKQNIQQGNAIEQDDLDELYEGMSRRQVLFVLGTPSIMDPFHKDRWDYVQTFSRRGSDPVQRTVTLMFEDDLLTQIIGRDDAAFALVEKDTDGDANAIATFVKKPTTSSSDPQEASLDSAEEEILNPGPDINAIDIPTAEELEYEEDMDVLDQTPEGGPMGPDIDG
jgi:outer membrane protein assembly factor BamE